MYGEPSAIREVARRLEERADAVRRRADELVARSEAADWVSLAADRMRASARDKAVRLRAVARDYDDAADRVREHAARVAAALDLIAEVERRARGLLEAVAGVVALPPPGHRDWLDVADRVPGVRL